MTTPAVQQPQDASPVVTPPPGVYPGVPMEQYHQWEGASNSRLSHLRRSPAHLQAYLAEPIDTVALTLGRAVHSAILEPDDFGSRYVAAPAGLDRRTKEGKATWERLLNTFGEGHVLKAEEAAMCLAVRDAVLVHSAARGMLTGKGHVELSTVWNDYETGVQCKGRLDRLSPAIAGGVVVDLKSTRDASRDAFERSIYSYGYHRQAALYLDATRAHGINAEHFVIVAFEKEPPYGVAVYRLTEGAIDAGRDQLQPLLRTYAKCLATNTWPCYPESVQDIALPAYAWSQIDEETREHTGAHA